MPPTSDLFYQLARAFNQRDRATEDMEEARRNLSTSNVEAQTLIDALVPVLERSNVPDDTVFDVADTLLLWDGETLRPCHRGYIADVTNGHDLFAPVVAECVTDED